jgi:putative integral membrane protein (TIGR02587 family)
VSAVDTTREYVRAMGGGLLVGLPLLFTQEMWAHAFLIHPWKLGLLLAVAFGIVVALNLVSGFRADRTRLEVVVDSIETMGIGIVVATVALLVLGRLEGGLGLRDSVGKVAIESIPIAFGASVARAQLSDGDGEADEAEQPVVSAFGRLLIAAAGALLFALNVAPTEEPVQLGVEASPWLLVAAIVASLVVTGLLVFYADFPGGRRLRSGGSTLEHPVGETVAAYCVSLLVAYGLLWAFDRVEGASIEAVLGMTVMLGVVASVGAAVGRLLVGGSADADGAGGPSAGGPCDAEEMGG